MTRGSQSMSPLRRKKAPAGVSSPSPSSFWGGGERSTQLGEIASGGPKKPRNSADGRTWASRGGLGVASPAAGSLVPARVSSLGTGLGGQGSGLGGARMERLDNVLNMVFATLMATRDDVNVLDADKGLFFWTSCRSFTAAHIPQRRVNGVLRRRGLPRICSEPYGTVPRLSKRKTDSHLCCCP